MPFALITIGLIMVVTGVRNTYGDFASQVKSDFTGPGNFTYWVASIGAIGALGYVEALRPFANMFLALVILVMVLKNGGVFDKFKSALDSGPQASASTPTPAPVQQQSATSAGQSTAMQKASADFAMVSDALVFFGA